MPLGPGKYDRVCTMVRNLTGGRLVAVIVLEGKEGTGFAVQAVPELVAVMPSVLRTVASEIEASGT